MDLYTNQHSPISEPDVPLPSLTQFSSHFVRTESMSGYPYTDPRPFAPQVIDSLNFGVSNDLDNYGCTDTRTYMSLIPAEVDVTESTGTFFAPSDVLNCDYKPPLFSMNDYIFVNSKDEGYVSPTASLHSLTPPSELTQLNVRDSANDSGNSNDVTGIYERDDQSHFRVTESSQSSLQPPRTQCVKCGTFVEIAQCSREATGHYLCYSCHVNSSPTLVPVQGTTEEPVQKRTRKKQSAIANSRNQICQNCECPNTTLWRRSFSGEAVCNACGLYEKLHKRKRPKSMRKDTIQTRRRKPRNTEAKKKGVAEVVSLVTASTSNAITTTNRVIPQPMTIPSHPPPPYGNHRYLTLEDTGNYQILPPMGNLGFFNFSQEATMNHIPGQKLELM